MLTYAYIHKHRCNFALKQFLNEKEYITILYQLRDYFHGKVENIQFFFEKSICLYNLTKSGCIYVYKLKLICDSKQVRNKRWFMFNNYLNSNYSQNWAKFRNLYNHSGRPLTGYLIIYRTIWYKITNHRSLSLWLFTCQTRIVLRIIIIVHTVESLTIFYCSFVATRLPRI